jgi:hypothetical protein
MTTMNPSTPTMSGQKKMSSQPFHSFLNTADLVVAS